jgi:hypothetical protein
MMTNYLCNTRSLLFLLVLQEVAFLVVNCKEYKPRFRNMSPNLSVSTSNTVHVYVLAGQSNMEGHGEIDMKESDGHQKNGTLLYQTHDPRTKDEFQVLWDNSTNTWRSLHDVKIWFNEAGYEMGVNGTRIPGVNGQDYSAGDLTVGYGEGGTKRGDFFGPELGFGFHIDKPKTSSDGDKVLLIKTAWGGNFDVYLILLLLTETPCMLSDLVINFLVYTQAKTWLMTFDHPRRLEPGIRIAVFPTAILSLLDITTMSCYRTFPNCCSQVSSAPSTRI